MGVTEGNLIAEEQAVLWGRTERLRVTANKSLKTQIVTISVIAVNENKNISLMYTKYRKFEGNLRIIFKELLQI